jgi:hypothetical protein
MRCSGAPFPPCAPPALGARHNSGVHGVFGVAPGPEGTPLSPVGCPDWEEHRRQDPLRTFRRQRYHRAVHIEYARIHASGAGFPELFISASRTRGSRAAISGKRKACHDEGDSFAVGELFRLADRVRTHLDPLADRLDVVGIGAAARDRGIHDGDLRSGLDQPDREVAADEAKPARNQDFLIAVRQGLPSPVAPPCAAPTSRKWSA